MISNLKQYLSRRKIVRIRDSRYTPSAVLIPLYCKDGQYHVIFTLRTNTVPTHKGEISFPGGAFESSDASLQETALREAFEEIGLKPQDAGLLGQLDDMVTTASNYLISPFVALVPYPYQFILEKEETAELIEVPIRHLLDKGQGEQVVEQKNGRPLDSYIYEYRGKIIHGATARILHQFLEIWEQVESDTSC
jgi:8-oxo-dGTP pyrophosphatase MutT (NUDIX family)